MFKNKLESMSSDIYTLKSSVHKILEHLEKLKNKLKLKRKKNMITKWKIKLKKKYKTIIILMS